MSLLPGVARKTIIEVMDEPDYLHELVHVAGLDPKEDLRYAGLAGLDFGNADIAGWDFTGATLNGADLSKVKHIEKAVFDEDTELNDVSLPEGITVDFLRSLRRTKSR